jgi:hypothetical protein
MSGLIWPLLGAGIGYWVGGFDSVNDAIVGAVIGLGVSILIGLLVLAGVFAVAASDVKTTRRKFR